MTGALRAAVEALLGERIGSVEPLSRDPRRAPTVWRVVVHAGRECAVKQVASRVPQTLDGKDALHTEAAVLRMLHEMHAAVPRPIRVDEDARLLITEWIAGETLDDLCQDDPNNVRAKLPGALSALAHVERALNSRVAEVEPYVFDHDYDAYLGDDFDHFADLAWSGYRQLLVISRQADAGLEADCREAWTAAVDVIKSSQPTLGSLDYNARNVMLSGSEPFFIDFSTVGWDWPERRVVQYFTALGAYRADGNFVSALTRADLVEARDALFFNPDALEAHQVVFLSLAVDRLLRGGIERPPDATTEEMTGWANRVERFDTAVGLLANGALTEFAPTRFLREQLRDIL